MTHEGSGQSPASDPGVRRRLVHAGRAIQLEDSVLPHDHPLGRGFSDRDQIVIPYHGVFGWHVGRSRRLIDSNVILFVKGGEEFYETHPSPSVGHASAIISPDPTLLGEGKPSEANSTRTLRDTTRLQVHHLLFGDMTSLEREERLVRMVADLVVHDLPQVPKAPRRIVEEAKEILHADLGPRLTLEAVADAVNVTPIYLTQAFSRSEGMPLYRYQLRLRLARALKELPRTTDLTELALSLGFNSHSHFTSTFRAVFGVTPGTFRGEQQTAA